MGLTQKRNTHRGNTFEKNNINLRKSALGAILLPPPLCFHQTPVSVSILLRVPGTFFLFFSRLCAFIVKNFGRNFRPGCTVPVTWMLITFMPSFWYYRIRSFIYSTRVPTSVTVPFLFTRSLVTPSTSFSLSFSYIREGVPPRTLFKKASEKLMTTAPFI